MKKLILTLALMSILMFSLLAEVQKVAIVKFEKNDRPSDYVYKEMTKRDFENVFKDNENLELIKIKDAEKAFKKSGFAYMGKDEARTLGTDLEADFVLWGGISSASNNEFKVQLNVYSLQTSDVFPIIFNVTKNKEDRRAMISENLLTKIEESGQAEVTKLMDIGLQHFNSKNFASAEESFSSLIQIDPQNVDAYFYLGAIKYLNKEYEASVDYYLQGLEIDPENVNMLDFLSKSYLKMEYYEEAVDALEQIAAIDENNKEIWYRIGNIYSEIEYYGDAEAAFRKALEIDENYSEACQALGVLLYDQELYDDAIQPLLSASQAFPDVDHLQKKLAKCYLKTGKLDDAIQQYKSVLVEQPENVNAYMNLAGAYRVTGQNQEALNTLLQLKNINPELPKVYLRIADIYLVMKDYGKTIQMADKALELDANLYDSYMIKAQVKFEQGYKKYEKFLWYEEEYKDKSRYYGEAADQLVEDRDRVKEEAYNLFLEEEALLNKAQGMTSDPSVLKEIKNKKATLQQLKSATKPGGF
ncbi:MAG: tetratricopeptide repeat protein [Candidatus Cloacimonetes bacterium]|nr:tetratricopeptide repeat protein [Candidatus Cloacimonadota bacterium]MCF7813505.1 tetratricopeptide repeat protein [Candidatus Cloacimonadota bacterium]MCF7868572.1 tetratricopeptide repeat protein [Candidatus Cloacimonadota bacterium]MCF7883360.1 tetratricopeptide repeat protein [Candidatus Cloacimonadota bacterium]